MIVGGCVVIRLKTKSNSLYHHMKSLRTYHKQNRQKLEFNIIYMFANYEYGFIT